MRTSSTDFEIVRVNQDGTTTVITNNDFSGTLEVHHKIGTGIPTELSQLQIIPVVTINKYDLTTGLISTTTPLPQGAVPAQTVTFGASDNTTSAFDSSILVNKIATTPNWTTSNSSLSLSISDGGSVSFNQLPSVSAPIDNLNAVNDGSVNFLNIKYLVFQAG